MRTWKLTLEYDGARYSGWQEQSNARTVAGELRKAAEDFFNRQVEIGGAGRTDAGVHALAQVAHLRLSPRGGRPKNIPRPQEILYAINDRFRLTSTSSKLQRPPIVFTPATTPFHGATFIKSRRGAQPSAKNTSGG